MLEEKFFEVYEINPIIKRGEYYFSTDCRVNQLQADQDIYPELNLEKLESVLGTFTLTVTPGPADENIYVYKVGALDSKPCIFRLHALLEFLIDYKELYKDRIKLLLRKD